MATRVVSCYLRVSQKTYEIIDRLAYHSKSLYNVALYNARQHYATTTENTHTMRGLRPDIVGRVPILVGTYLPYTRSKNFPYKEFSNYVQTRQNENYPLLHSDAAQQTIRSVDEAYRGYFALLKMWYKGELEFRPGLPRYLDKDGRYKLAFPRAHLTIRNRTVTLGMSNTFRKQHGLTGKELTFEIPKCIKPHQIREVTLVPVHGGKNYKIEFAYTAQKYTHDLDSTQYLAIDLGLNNFATFIESTTGTATILDGAYLKSLNRWYNKTNARLQNIKDRQGLTDEYTTRQSRLTVQRNNRIDEAMNRMVCWILDHAIRLKIGTVVLPRWDGIKDKRKALKKDNQNFQQIPHYRFRQKLKAKCEIHGIAFDDSKSEAYTSQTDALAFDKIKKQPYGNTRRIHRGLYQSITGVLINADVNAALNHLRNIAGDSLVREIIGRGRVNRPVRIQTAYEVPSLTTAHVKLPSCGASTPVASPVL